MKKVLFISLFALVGACIGCSNANPNEIYENLQNFKLKNLDDYQAIGVGSIKHSNAKRSKKALRGKEGENVETPVYISGKSSTSGHMESDEPFTLIGQLKNGSVENLSFVNEKTSLGFPINAYCVWGDFITFVPGNSSNEPPYMVNIDDSGVIAFNADNSFTLSKKTGKIYKTISLNEIGDDMSGVETCFKQADGSFLISYKSSLCKVYENEDGLNFKYLGNHDYDKLRIDKYGNAYVENGIITASDSKLHKFTTYLDGDANIFFDDVNKEIYARLNDRKSSYVFNENGEFVSTPACGVYEDYYYYDYQRKVNYNDPSTWGYAVLEEWLEKNKDQISNYEELKENNFATLTREQFLDAYCFYQSQFDDSEKLYVSLLDNGDIVHGSSNQQNNRLDGSKGIYGYRTLYSRENGVSFFFSNDIAEYQVLDQYAYLRKEISPKDEIYKIVNNAEVYNIIQRGNYLYSLNAKSRLYKYSFEEDKTEELILDGYNIKTMDIQDGQIVLTGTDDSFNEFEGCLDQNDQISFEKTKSSDVIVLTPIN